MTIMVLTPDHIYSYVLDLKFETSILPSPCLHYTTGNKSMQNVVKHKTQIMQNDSDAKMVGKGLAAPPSAAGSYCYLITIV